MYATRVVDVRHASTVGEVNICMSMTLNDTSQQKIKCAAAMFVHTCKACTDNYEERRPKMLCHQLLRTCGRALSEQYSPVMPKAFLFHAFIKTVVDSDALFFCT